MHQPLCRYGDPIHDPQLHTTPCICTHARALLGLMTASFRCTWVSLSRRIARCASHASHHHSYFLAAHSNLSCLGDSLIAKLLGMGSAEEAEKEEHSTVSSTVRKKSERTQPDSTAQHTKATTTRQRTREWLAINFDAVYPEVCNRQPSSLPVPKHSRGGPADMRS